MAVGVEGAAPTVTGEGFAEVWAWAATPRPPRRARACRWPSPSTPPATRASARSAPGVVSFTGVGNCLIDANQAGNGIYNPASQVQQNFSVAAAALLGDVLGVVGVAGDLTPVTMTSAIAPGMNRGTSGFRTTSVVVPRHGYITLFAQTNRNLAGSLVQIWAESKTSGWHVLTERRVASDGTVHYYARVSGWTAYSIRFTDMATYVPAGSHGRIATNPA
jgi:hypothetical protein